MTLTDLKTQIKKAAEAFYSHRVKLMVVERYKADGNTSENLLECVEDSDRWDSYNWQNLKLSKLPATFKLDIDVYEAHRAGSYSNELIENLYCLVQDGKLVKVWRACVIGGERAVSPLTP